MTTFALNGNPYIQLNQLLKLLGWVETGGIANQLITEGAVKVNGRVETRKRNKLHAGDLVEFAGYSVTVVESDQ